MNYDSAVLVSRSDLSSFVLTMSSFLCTIFCLLMVWGRQATITITTSVMILNNDEDEIE